MTEKRMKTITRAELLNMVVREIIQQLQARPIIDTFFDIIDIERDNSAYSLLDTDEYVLARLKNITDDRLIEIAQHELDRDITQFTDIKIPKGVAMTGVERIALAKVIVEKLTEDLVDRDKIEMFFDHIDGHGSKHMFRPDISFKVRMVACLSYCQPETLLKTMQNELDMDIKPFTNTIIPKSDEILIIKKMEIVERVATELASRLNSNDSVDAFLSELGIDVSRQYERRHHSVKEHIIFRIGTTNQKMYIKIAQEELEMDISDLLT